MPKNRRKTTNFAWFSRWKARATFTHLLIFCRMHKIKKASLELADGTVMQGYSFGHDSSTAGELVFNTAMTGYPESLTDPSYEGQILVTTYPLAGNYGVPPAGEKESVSRFYESLNIHARAIVTQDYSWEHSHWQADRSLAQWLQQEGVPGIYGIDTRELAKYLRTHGSTLARITVEGSDKVPFYNPDEENLVAKTSCTEVEEYGSGDRHVVLVDCGVKHNIIRCLTSSGVRVTRVPWDYDFLTIPYDGLFISNGPGNPDCVDATVHNLRRALDLDKPICGICMGNQLLAKAAGAGIYKLPFGHRGHNQPVRRVGTNQCYITSQNHGFAVDADTLPPDWEPLFINLNDGSIEGIRHKSKPFFSAQFHPEASSGPKDTEFLFDEFISML